MTQQNDKHWWQGAVIYQIYPRSFCDTTGNGVGDLRGITAKLDYVASLGVDGVWISPFFKSPMVDFGYDVADPRDVDPLFGTLDDFDKLLEKAHSLGLRVIIDQVYSHVSNQCEWFLESKKSVTDDKADWFIWADAKPDGTPPNNWRGVFAGAAWTWDATRRQYYMHNFLPEQPDLNLHNPDVQEEILSVARFWMERGVDGFRLDATNHYMHDPDLRDNPPWGGDKIPEKPFDYQDHIYNQSHPDIPDFLRRLRAELDRYGDTFTVAEVGGRRCLEEMADYTAGDDLLNTAYSFVFLEEADLSVEAIKGALENWDIATDSWPSWTFSNHDRMRVVSRWAAGRDEKAFAKAMNALLLCLRGTIFLYQGEELGLPHAYVPFERLVDPEALQNWPDTLNRDGCRTPMPWAGRTTNAGWASDTWLPIDDRHFDLSVEAQEKEDASSLHFLRRLTALRKVTPALVSGSLTFLEAGEDILAFVRELDGDRILCAFNLGHEGAVWTGAPTVAERLLDVGNVTCTDDDMVLGVCGGMIARL